MSFGTAYAFGGECSNTGAARGKIDHQEYRDNYCERRDERNFHRIAYRAQVYLETIADKEHPDVQSALEEVPFDVPQTDVKAVGQGGQRTPEGVARQDDEPSQATGISRGGQTRAGAGELAQEAGGPESGQITTETTEAGEQTVIPGAQKISDKEQAQR